jgi:hypothetical protein
MEQNKTGKYFKYAIGEIILVVIGILIAIQANNWNIDRNVKIDLNQSLDKLLVALNQDFVELNNEIDQNNTYITALDSCLIILKEPEKYSIDKFEKLFHNTNFTMTFEFARVTFDELSNSGKIKQLDNTKLSDSLIIYYGDIRYKAVEDALIHHVRNNIRTYTLGFDYLNFNDEFDNYQASDFKINKKTLLDYSSDVRIINAIRLKIVLHRTIEYNYKAIIPRTEYLINTIEEELKSK